MNVIFAGAGVLLSVAVVLDYPHSLFSDIEPTQTAKDVIAIHDALLDIFDRIENFFRRLEEYTEVPTTEAMKEIIVKIMVEVLGIFGIVTKEIKQGRASESITDDMWPIADRASERYLKKLTGRRDIEDALSRLDRLTQEEVKMATAQVLKVAHRVEHGVETMGGQVMGVGSQVTGLSNQVASIDKKVKDVDDKVNVAVKGAFNILAQMSS